MTTPASQYEYRGPKAAYWDLLRGDTSRWEDRPFYWAAIKASGEPALDVGCGTGRLLLDFLAQGINIDGVDNSPEMLELCRQKAQPLGLRPALFQQSMEDLQLPRAYHTIIVPSSSFSWSPMPPPRPRRCVVSSSTSNPAEAWSCRSC